MDRPPDKHPVEGPDPHGPVVRKPTVGQVLDLALQLSEEDLAMLHASLGARLGKKSPVDQNQVPKQQQNPRGGPRERAAKGPRAGNAPAPQQGNKQAPKKEPGAPKEGPVKQPPSVKEGSKVRIGTEVVRDSFRPPGIFVSQVPGETGGMQRPETVVVVSILNQSLTGRGRGDWRAQSNRLTQTVKKKTVEEDLLAIEGKLAKKDFANTDQEYLESMREWKKIQLHDADREIASPRERTELFIQQVLSYLEKCQEMRIRPNFRFFGDEDRDTSVWRAAVESHRSLLSLPGQ